MSERPPPPPDALRALYDAESSAPPGGDRARIRARIATTVAAISAAGPDAAASTGATATTTAATTTAANAAVKLTLLAVLVAAGGAALHARHRAADAPATVAPSPSREISAPATVTRPGATPAVAPPSAAPPADDAPVRAASAPGITPSVAPPSARTTSVARAPVAPVSGRSSTARAAGSLGADAHRAASPAARHVAARGPERRADEHAPSIRRAWAARARGDAQGVLTIVDDDARVHPDGVLAEEREALRIDALWRLGREADARARAATFVARHPGSLHRALVAPALKESP